MFLVLALGEPEAEVERFGQTTPRLESPSTQAILRSVGVGGWGLTVPSVRGQGLEQRVVSFHKS